jgi:hypothetical protein
MADFKLFKLKIKQTSLIMGVASIFMPSQFVEFAEPAGDAPRRKSSAHHSKFRGCDRI